ncbi:MAG: 2-phospho-L-lactate transferase [Phenylobacterium sp.]
MAQVVALCGGVGGAKLACGLAARLTPDELTIVVNTGDDFEHLGLTVCPDLDSVVYAMAGLSDRERGWGLAGETGGFISALRRLGGEAWFNLGDHDLAMHVERTRRLAAGEPLSAVTAALSERLGVAHRVTPMSDDPVRTFIATAEGPLPFQVYFVRERCEPVATGFEFRGAAQARPNPDALAALRGPDLAAIVICPSNPYVSIDPILATPGFRQALVERRVPCVAVSPIVGGEALKGPLAKMMAELGLPVGIAAIAQHYRGLIDGLVIDDVDAADRAGLEAEGLAVLVTGSVMRSDADRERLAADTLAFAGRLRRA